MVMRVGGIVSGMDIEAMVDKLMEAERMPVERLKQQQTQLEWKRDAYREINTKLLELDNLMLDLKLSSTYNPKKTQSSQSTAVTATASSSATNGTYDIQVLQIATRAMNVGESLGDVDLTTKLSAEHAGEYTFYTFDDAGNKLEHHFKVVEGDTLQGVLNKISQASDGNVRAFFDESANRVVLEATRTGSYNDAGAEITFEDNQLFAFLGLSEENETGGENARFIYNNGLTIESRENTHTLNGISFEFHHTTTENARISVQTDVEQSFDKIMNFIEKYNEVMDLMNKTQTEERYRDYLPLSEAQKADMTDKQIELWEEKAKSGLLRGDRVIQNGMYSLRNSLQQLVASDGEYTLLSNVGITTTTKYLDGGKLEVDEEKLKAALRDHPDDVYQLFASNSKDEARGLIYRFDEALKHVRSGIERQAGRSSQTLDNYALGKQMKANQERINEYEQRMIQVEQRYWNQFTQMEKAIARLTEQSNILFSQFGQM